MTQDETIELAKRAGIVVTGDAVLKLCQLVAEKEREACATMSDWILKEGGGTWGDAIRARGQALAQPKQDGECKHCTDGCPACDARKL